MQKSAQFIRTRVAPVLEDTVVELSNAAVPVVNRGLDAVETGISASASAVSKKTSEGLDHIGQKVLGEERRNRLKKITDNISINFNNSLNSLAGVIKEITLDDNTTDIDQITNKNDKSNLSSTRHSSQFFQPHLYPPYDHYQSKYHNYYKGYSSNSENDIDESARDMTIPKAISTVIKNTAYNLSKKFLGTNLTDAVVPIARSVSTAIEQRLPSTSSDEPKTTPALEKLRTCTTPSRAKGYCQDLSDCPDLVLKLSVLRKSICFKKLFSPGVCCPDTGQM